MGEYQKADKHNYNVRNTKKCGDTMDTNKGKSKGIIEITFSSTNLCQFKDCLEKIIKEHCK